MATAAAPVKQAGRIYLIEFSLVMALYVFPQASCWRGWLLAYAGETPDPRAWR